MRRRRSPRLRSNAGNFQVFPGQRPRGVNGRANVGIKASGAVGFFRKPVDGDALVDLIGSVCV